MTHTKNTHQKILNVNVRYKMTAEKLLKRISKAKEEKHEKEADLHEAYRYCLPIRDTLRNKTSTVEKGIIYSSDAKIALEKFATRAQALLTPAWDKWSILTAGSEIPEENKDQLQEILDKTTQILFDHIHHSNFYTASHEAMLDCAISTGALIVEENFNPKSASILNFRAIPISDIIPEKCANGKIETVFREFELKVEDIERLWQNANVPQTLKERASGDSNFKTKVYEGIVYDEDKYNYKMIVLSEAEKFIMYEEEMDSSPFVVFRESVRPGEVLGYGRALRVMEDIKTLNKMMENALRADGINSMPVFTAVDDGGFNPYNVTLQPGTIIPVASNDSANPTIRPLPVANGYTLAENRMQQLRQTINEVFMANPYGQITESPVRSATEIASRNSDIFQSTSSGFGRLQTEYTEKILKRCVDILAKAGKIPDLKVDGKQITIKFTSPFSRMQGNEEVKNIMEWLSYLQGLGQEVLVMSVNLEKIPSNLAKKMGIDKELYKGDTEMEEIKGQLMQQMQQQGGVPSQS